MNIRTAQILVISLLCLGIYIDPIHAQRRDAQKEYDVDSILYVYYMRCRSELNSPAAMQMTDTLYEMAKAKNDQRMQAVALCFKLDHHYFKGSHQDSLIYHTNVVKEFARKNNQPKYYYFAWGKRLIYYYIKHRQYNIALYEAKKMRQEAEQENYTEGIATAYNVLSTIYTSKKQAKLAAEQKEKENEIILKYDLDKFNLSTNYVSLANLYFSLKDPEKAYECLKESQKYIFSPSHEYYMNCRFAKYYLQKKEYNKARTILDSIEKLISKEKELQAIIADYLLQQRAYYLAIGQYSKALEVQNKYRKALADKNESNSEEPKLRGEIYALLGNYEEALKHYTAYINENDSINSILEETTASEFAAILGVERLNVEKVELESQIQERDLTNKQRIIFFLCAVLTLGLVILYREHLLNSRLLKSQKDLSEKNKALLASEESLRHATKQAENASRMKSEFIQNMSHEIRTPLNSIVGFSQILSSYFAQNDETKEFTQIIEKNSTNLLQLVTDVLDISQLDGEPAIPCNQIANLTEIGQSCINNINGLTYKEVVISYLPEHESFPVKTNPERIKQILMNLLTNAAKFTTQGEIVLAYHIAEEEICFTVSDTGTGIPSDKHQFIFERFSKIDSFMQGTGLGLPLSRMIAQKMGGDLAIDPHYTKGARFLLTLPLKE